MRKLVLAYGILASVVSVGSAMSDEEWNRARDNCFENDKSACQALIDNGLPSVEQCNKGYGKNSCNVVGLIYSIIGRYREAIPYLKKAIALGDDLGYGMLGATYNNLQDYYNAKKYYEIGCEKVNAVQAENCYNLGLMYANGKGVRQDYAKAAELYKKACDMKEAKACYNLGVLYYNGQGVRQNLSTAKQYYGKACDLGKQLGCDNYKSLNNQGVR